MNHGGDVVFVRFRSEEAVREKAISGDANKAPPLICNAEGALFA